MDEAALEERRTGSTGDKSYPVTYRALYSVFFWIGLFSFGGGLMPWIQREIVTKRGWMRDEQFLPGVAMAQILPGVNSTNMAVYVGRHLLGVSGATVALIGMLTGPFAFMIGGRIHLQGHPRGSRAACRDGGRRGGGHRHAAAHGNHRGEDIGQGRAVADRDDVRVHRHRRS